MRCHDVFWSLLSYGNVGSAGDDQSECLFCNALIDVNQLTSHMRHCRIKVEEEEREAVTSAVSRDSSDVRSAATDVDLLVRSLSQRFKVSATQNNKLKFNSR